MVTVAFSFDGKFCVGILPAGDTVNADNYQAFLRKVIHNYSRHVDPLVASDMVLMHDNARPHTAMSTVRFLQKKGITLLKQPPYSPDYNMLDRWVFTVLERNRTCRSFESEEDVNSYVTGQLRNLSKDDLSYQFQKLKSDLRQVIDARGSYL